MTLNIYDKIYKEHNTLKKEKYEDGLYIVNHIYNEDGQSERTISIENGLVNTKNYSFSQLNFFEVNKMVKKL